MEDKKKKETATPQYVATVGLNYGDTRVEAGEIAENLPEKSVSWLLAAGHIKEVGK